MFEPCGFVDALFSDEYEYLLVDGVVAHPRGDHGDEPFAETASPEVVFVGVCECYLVSHLSYPVGFFLRIIVVLLLYVLAQWVYLR